MHKITIKSEKERSPEPIRGYGDDRLSHRLPWISMLSIVIYLLSLCPAGYAQGPSPVQSYCEGQDYSFTTIYDAKWDYSWVVLKNGAIVYQVDNPVPSPNILDWTAPSDITEDTVFIISVVVSDKSLTTCKSEDSMEITVHPLPTITIKKYTNGEDADTAPGPYIPEGGAVTWRYEVTTDSNLPLTDITVTDSVNGVTPIYVSGDTNGDGKLTSDETWIFEASGIAVAGQYANIGYVTAKNVCDLLIMDDDPSHYFGETGVITIKKYTNGEDADAAPGPYIPEGGSVTWRYEVTTTSNVPLSAITVTDSVTGVSPVYVSGDTNGDSKLTSDETWIFEVTGTAIPGQYENIGTVNGITPGQQTLTDDDPSHYFGETGVITIKKYTNGEDADAAPGPYIPEGGAVTWRYEVTTTSNVPLSAITVTDSVPGVSPVYVSGDTNGDSKLTSDETWIFEVTGTAIPGQYENIGTVTGITPGQQTLTDDDPSHYFGEAGVITIKKYTNGEDADAAPGPYIPEGGAVTWRYEVTTTSNVPLSAITVTDSVPGVSPVYVSGDTNSDSKLTFDETWIFEATGTAIPGQYENIGTVTGITPGQQTLTDDDPSHYFGETGVITIKKYTNGEDADAAPGPYIPEGGAVTWRYEVTTTSNVPLSAITVTDSVPGVSPVYISGDTNGDSKLTSDETWIFEATGTAIPGQYENIGTVTGITPGQQTLTDDDPSHYFGETGVITIKKYTNGEDADAAPGPYIPEGGAVTWRYEVTTTSNVPLSAITVTDSVPGVSPVYISGDTNGDSKLTSDETWIFEATGTAIAGQYENIGTVTGITPGQQTLTDDDPSHYFGEMECTLELTKTALNETVERGQDIYYNIGLCNPCPWSYPKVILRDVLPSDVELVSVDPPASLSDHTLTWDLGKMDPQRCFNAVVVVRVPLVNMSYDMEQEVQGEGFVNVHNDYDTHHEPKNITNCAYAEAYVYAPEDNLDANPDDNLVLMETISSCASTRVVDPGTELRRREFGSGSYASEELTRVRMENKSIQSATSLSASHKPTTFSLPGGSSITYGSKWTEKSKGINYATGATMNEEYTFANKIDKERVVDLDKNGSTMKTDVSFTGTGHIGVLKKDEPDSHPKVKPTYEATEDYTGSFQVNEMVDEYGSNVRSEKSVTGYGYAAVDKRVSNNQRTYESGTGSYDSEEQIETASNYIAKDINLVYGPTNYSYTPSFATNQNIKWSEGMWSKSGVLAGGVILAALPTSGCGGEAPANTSAPATYISERYSSLNYLDKETVAAGLNEMKTNASFSGMADFRAKATYSNKTGEIDNEERYVGEYDITRKVQFTGVSKYGRPHITVTKEGNMTTRWFNKTMANVAEYTITIVNDGNVALAPIHIRDIFPPGTEYIYSSIRPESYTNSEANWSLMNLGVGNSIQLELTLNVTDYAPGNVVNRVMVCGMNGDEGCVSGSAYSALEFGGMTCCPPEVVLDKVANIDATDPTLIHYTIVVQNNANSTVAATLTDMLPAGLNYMSATNQPDIQSGQFLQWIIPTLEPGDVTTIEYQARATMNGPYVNEVHMDATAVDGTGYDTEDAAARVYIGSTGVAPRTTRYGGWQVPDWNMTSPDQGITVSLSPDEDSAAEFPTMYG